MALFGIEITTNEVIMFNRIYFKIDSWIARIELCRYLGLTTAIPDRFLEYVSKDAIYFRQDFKAADLHTRWKRVDISI